MTTTDAQTTPYTISAELPVSPDEAFALVTEPERLRRWKTVSATVDLRAGGGYRFTVTPGHVVSGTYRVVEPGRRVVFGWGWEGSDALPPDASTVTVTIEPTETGSRVTIEHAGLDAEQAAGHAAGWEHFVERLQRLAATGDAGPDEWAAAPDPIDPLVAAEAALAALQPVLRAPDGRGPAEADAVRRLHLPRRRGAPDGVDAPPSGACRAPTSCSPETGSLETKVVGLADQAITAWRERGLDGTVTLGNGFELPAATAAALPRHRAAAPRLGPRRGLRPDGWSSRSRSSTTYARWPSGRRPHRPRQQVRRRGRAPAPDADALERLAAYAGRVTARLAS